MEQLFRYLVPSTPCGHHPDQLTAEEHLAYVCRDYEERLDSIAAARTAGPRRSNWDNVVGDPDDIGVKRGLRRNFKWAAGLPGAEGNDDPDFAALHAKFTPLYGVTAVPMVG